MIDKRKALSFCILVVPWLTSPLLGKNSFVRFLPVATFVGYIFSFLSEIADEKKWWKVKNALFPNFRLDFSYLLGLFFITTIWIFKLTFNNFFKYLFTNMAFDYFFVFHVVKFFTKVGVFEFKKMRPKHFYVLSVVTAIIIYFYQRLVERTIVHENNQSLTKI
ncbi:hypothetical protein [Neobacillus sp. LXY-4]|uniref:hypothetical protein n=1 Tax=Neobacillus sp. LXY-4 TaxID=3379826 RepID=UPI003EDEC53D